MNANFEKFFHTFCVNATYKQVWNIKIKNLGMKIGIPTSDLKVNVEDPLFRFFDLEQKKTFSVPYSAIEEATSDSDCSLILELPSPILFWSKYEDSWSLLSSSDYTIKIGEVLKESEDKYSWGITDWEDYPEYIEKGIAGSLEEAKIAVETALVNHGMANGKIRDFKTYG